MKTIIRASAIYLLILYFLPQMIPGFTIEGGIVTFLIGAFTLALMFLIIKPILTIISFPVNLLTMGIFSIFINALILYLLTVIIPDITIQPFIYNKLDLGIAIIPKLEFNTFFAYVYTGFVIATIDSVIKWLIK